MSDSNDKKNQILEDERAILLDHDYDGIQELDHPLPTWWLWLFYLTIAFSYVYAAYYLSGSSPTLRQELQIALKELEIKRAPTKSGGDISDESLLALLAVPEKVEIGKAVFTGKCAACHGDRGQGVIGPNLTDNYWLHGTGRPSEIATVIRDGVPEKGMPPWGPILSQDELINVTVFIRSIRGSNPPGAKEPQGALHAAN